MHQASCRAGSPPNTRPFKVLHIKTYECVRTYALLFAGLFAKSKQTRKFLATMTVLCPQTDYSPNEC